jgi:hypothetical protein
MAESNLPTTSSSSNLPNRSVEFTVGVLLLMSLGTALYGWLGLRPAELAHRLVASSGGPLSPGF